MQQQQAMVQNAGMAPGMAPGMGGMAPAMGAPGSMVPSQVPPPGGMGGEMKSNVPPPDYAPGTGSVFERDGLIAPKTFLFFLPLVSVGSTSLENSPSISKHTIILGA